MVWQAGGVYQHYAAAHRDVCYGADCYRYSQLSALASLVSEVNVPMQCHVWKA